MRAGGVGRSNSAHEACQYRGVGGGGGVAGLAPPCRKEATRGGVLWATAARRAAHAGQGGRGGGAPLLTYVAHSWPAAPHPGRRRGRTLRGWEGPAQGPTMPTYFPSPTGGGPCSLFFFFFFSFFSVLDPPSTIDVLSVDGRTWAPRRGARRPPRSPWRPLGGALTAASLSCRPRRGLCRPLPRVPQRSRGGAPTWDAWRPCTSGQPRRGALRGAGQSVPGRGPPFFLFPRATTAAGSRRRAGGQAGGRAGGARRTCLERRNPPLPRTLEGRLVTPTPHTHTHIHTLPPPFFLRQCCKRRFPEPGGGGQAVGTRGVVAPP